jgi:hypothetical protein
MIHARGIVGVQLLAVLAIWLATGVPSSAAARQNLKEADFPNGNPCAGQELTLEIDGQKGSPILSYGPATVRGVLHCGTVPIRSASIAVAEVGEVPGAPAIAPSVTTGLDGSFVYTIPPGPNRVLSFSYTSYSDDPGPSVSATATLRVRPSIKLQIEPRRVRNHHWIFWTVTVLGGPFPSQGITLDTQVHVEGHWKIFDQVVVHREGISLVYKYRFLRTYWPTTYPFRLAMPATGSNDYPYTSGTSNVVKVHVNP